MKNSSAIKLPKWQDIELRALSWIDLKSHNKQELTYALDAIRKALTNYHADLRNVDELESKLIQYRIEICIKLAKRVKWSLYRLDHHDNSDFMAKIQKAKSVNIERILPFPVKRNRTTCPFCTGKSKNSMMIKDNFAWCFRNNTGYDSIDLIMELENLTFKEAVLSLCNR